MIKVTEQTLMFLPYAAAHKLIRQCLVRGDARRQAIHTMQPRNKKEEK